LSHLLNARNRRYQFGLAMRVPLFAGPAMAAGKIAASARVQQAEHGARATFDGARLELASASTELASLRGSYVAGL
jgi:outer membrane protein TolC